MASRVGALPRVSARLTESTFSVSPYRADLNRIEGLLDCDADSLKRDGADLNFHEDPLKCRDAPLCRHFATLNRACSAVKPHGVTVTLDDAALTRHEVILNSPADSLNHRNANLNRHAASVHTDGSTLLRDESTMQRDESALHRDDSRSHFHASTLSRESSRREHANFIESQ